jgi:hypothetical protein
MTIDYGYYHPVWEDVMLVLLIERIYEIAVEMASCSMVYVPRFLKIGKGVQATLIFCFRNFSAVMLVLLVGGI